MKGLIDFFIERSLLVNLLTFIIFVVGAFSLVSLQKETGEGPLCHMPGHRVSYGRR